jgi:hypothetical protein
MDIALTLDRSGSSHDDLVLTLGESVWRCDSYYLALDQRLLPDQQDEPKVRAVLRALLENWRTAILGLTSGGTAYLPYDFSDQGTAWLACELNDGDLEIRHGWARVEGFSLSPSAPLARSGKPAGFHADGGPPWSMSVDHFLEGIAQSIEAAA